MLLLLFCVLHVHNDIEKSYTIGLLELLALKSANY